METTLSVTGPQNDQRRVNIPSSDLQLENSATTKTWYNITLLQIIV